MARFLYSFAGARVEWKVTGQLFLLRINPTVKHKSDEQRPKISPTRKFLRALKRFAYVILSSVSLYALIVIVGLIPVNNNFEPTQNGVEIFVISNPVHADVVLPINTETVNWREHFPAKCFSGDNRNATHVAIGWGDKGFFIETPTWADLRVSTAAHALLLPSDTCMHVSLTRAEHLGDNSRSVTISAEQYERLIAFINASFQHNSADEIIQINDAAYGSNDAFFEALGTYHCVNTCNSWIGRAMRSAGIRTPWLTPLPKTVFLYLPD